MWDVLLTWHLFHIMEFDRQKLEEFNLFYMRYTGPKNRISRRENLDLGMKTLGSKSQANLLKKINVMPGQHGTRLRRKLSEHSRQLREKQKLRFSFGLTEKQLKNYFAVASRRRGNTGVHLSELVERRSGKRTWVRAWVSVSGGDDRCSLLFGIRLLPQLRCS